MQQHERWRIDPHRGVLEEAYLHAVYAFEDSSRWTAFTLAPTGALPITPAALGLAARWAIVTGCNPMSRVVADGENRARHGELVATVRALAPTGLRPSESRSRDDQATWREPGCLITGVPVSMALAIGRRFGQYAIVVGDAERAGLVNCQTERRIGAAIYAWPPDA